MIHSNVIQFPTNRFNSKRPPNNTTPKEAQYPGSGEPLAVQVPADGFDVTPYLPQGKEIKLLESSKGTQHIPHKIFEVMFKATSTKVDLIVFGCLLRYTLGFHRSKCEASLSFIAEWTGLTIPSIRRGIESLVSDHLIERMVVGNCTRDSTVYEIPIVKGYLAYSNLPPSLSTPIPPQKLPPNPVKEEIPNEDRSPSLGSNCIQYPAQTEHSPVQNDHSTMLNLSTKKDNSNKYLNKTLSPTQTLPEYLNKYLSDLKPQQKKEREQKLLNTLKNDYCLADISDAVKLLSETGVPATGERCHSPMAFLSVSMNSILPYVLEHRAKKKKREEISQQEAEKRRLAGEREAKETNNFSEALILFNQAFPTRDSREQHFKQFAVKNPMFSGGSFELKNIAISAWADSLKNNPDKL